MMNKKSSAWVIPVSLVLFALVSLPASAQTSLNADTADYVMTDFNYWSGTTNLGGYWYTFNDNGSATAVDTVFGNTVLTAYGAPGWSSYDTLGNLNRNVFPRGHGGDSTNNALRFGFIFGDRSLSCGTGCTYPAYAGFGTGFTPYDTLDFSAAAGVAFWAKSDSGPLVFNATIMTRDTITGAADYAQNFTLDTNWKLCVIKLVASDSFKQPDYSVYKPFAVTRATGIGFGMNLGNNATHPTNAMWIDDLVIQKWKYVDPSTIPDGVSAKAQPKDRRFAVTWNGSSLRVRLPAFYSGQSGRIQALDTRGRVMAETSFPTQSKEVELPWASFYASPNTVHFRVIAATATR